MSTAVYRRHASIQMHELETLIETIRRRQEARSPQEARRVTLAALQRWKANERSLRVFEPGRVA